MLHRSVSLPLSLVVLLAAACSDSKGSGGTGTGGGSPPAGSGGGSPPAGTGGAVAPGSGGSSGAGTGGSSGAGSGGAPPSDTAPPGEAGPPAAGIDQRCREMVAAAEAFLKGLEGDGNKRAQAALAFTARRHFKYTPGDRPGLPLGGMTEAQRMTAFALLKSGVSSDGFAKVETIRGLELVLRAQENSQTRDPLRYFVAVYGAPSATGDWAWHWEGHHLSLHFTLSSCTLIADTPTFLGANPARVGGTSPAGAPPAGTRALEKEEDLARALAMALSADAQKRAMAISGGNLREVPDSPAIPTPQTPAGLPASAMSPAEVEQLKSIITTYAAAMSPELAAARLAKIQDAGFDKVSFLWGGSLDTGQAHSYRVQGPTFLIEYLNAQGANHIHAAWRDFNGDFGLDVIKSHLDQVPH